MKNYPENLVKRVWQQTKCTNDKLKDFIRQDLADAWIDFKEYGKESDKGWVISPIQPAPDGSLNDIDNLDGFALEKSC